MFKAEFCQKLVTMAADSHHFAHCPPFLRGDCVQTMDCFSRDPMDPKRNLTDYALQIEEVFQKGFPKLRRALDPIGACSGGQDTRAFEIAGQEQTQRPPWKQCLL